MEIFATIELAFSVAIVTALMMVAMVLLQLRHQLRRLIVWYRELQTLTGVQLDAKANSVIEVILSRDFEELDVFDQEDIRSDVIGLLNLFESISLAVNQGVYSEEIARSALKHTFLLVFLKIQRTLYDLRSQRNAKNLFIEYEKLVRRWQEDPNFSSDDNTKYYGGRRL